MTRWTRRGVLKAVTAVPALLSTTAWPSTRERPSWTLPHERRVRVIENDWIVMADGIRLSARIWIPDGPNEQPSPVVLEYIPYRKRDSYRMHDDSWGQTLASRGIAYARVDVRGTGDSEGVMSDEYTEEELRDGVSCIDWLARQAWSNGAVGMRGISWGGINTLHIAARNPPALKAIMPMACTDSRYTDDAHYLGGTLGHTNFQWGVLFKTVMAGPPDPAISGPEWTDKWRARLEASPDILRTWLSHQQFDEYWRRGSIAAEAIKVPTYLVSGWQDTYSKPVLRLFGNLTCARKCLIGPWGHTYPWLAQPQGLDWATEEIRWWEHWLRGVDTGIMDDPIFQTFMNYAAASQQIPDPIPGRWIAEPAWPRRFTPLTLHLNTASQLSANPGRTRRVVHRGGTVVGLTKPEWLDRPSVEQSPDDERSLTFDTAPFDRDIEFLGQPKLHVRLQSSRPVAQLAVRLTEVTPTGASWLVSYGLLNLTHRQPGEVPSAITPGREYDVTIELFPIAHRFKRNHRLRIALSEGLWPLAWPSPEPADLTFTLGRHSRLELPVRQQETAPATLGIAELQTPLEPDTPRPRTTLAPVERGRYLIENNSPPHERTITKTGSVLSRGSWETSEIREGDYATCVWSQRAVATWKRADWDCAVEAGYELRANGAEFRLVETLIAKSRGETIFERSHTAIIPRDLL